MNVVRSPEEWRTIIADWMESGLSARPWCIKNGVAPSSFYYNVKKSEEQQSVVSGNTNGHKQEIIPLCVTDALDADQSDVALDSKYKDAVCEIQIEYNGIIVRVPSQAPERCFSSVIKALRFPC